MNNTPHESEPEPDLDLDTTVMQARLKLEVESTAYLAVLIGRQLNQEHMPPEKLEEAIELFEILVQRSCEHYQQPEPEYLAYFHAQVLENIYKR